MGYAEGSEIVKPDREQGRRLIEESVSLYGTLGDQWEAAHSAVILANITAALQPDHETRQMYEESLASFRALGDQWMVARTLNLLGSFEGGTGNLDLAQQLYEESLALSQAQGNRAGSVYSLRSLSALANIRGEFEAAKGYARQVTGLCRDTGNQYELGLGLMVSAAAFQWSGQFVEAHTILEEAIAESKEFQLPTFMAWIAYQQGAIKTYVGRYDKARVQVESTLAMARDKDYRRLTANCQETLACVMLGEEQHGEAQQLLLKCVTARRAERLDEDQVAGSLALLGRAVYGLGNRAEAQGYLLEALEMVIELGAFVSLMRLMPIIPVLLADEEDDALKERAVELYALAESQPFVANSQLFKDIAGKHIAAAAATLAPEVVEAARSRGRTLDWRDTAATLLDELRELGWAD
jgi:tetratricopeptide (TPR) repeat protein